MSEFDSKDFGERIKNYRIKKGLSQENIATSLGKSKAIVSRYEKGEVIPDAKDVSIICEELGIYEADLYENDTIRTMQHNKSKNPFGTDKLYVYFNAYNFRTKKFDGYGQLIGQNLDDLQAGARINVDERKEDPMDFAIWKAQKPGEPAWDCPWGKGRPGWHIECSCMAKNLLGDTIDIHAGGMDLAFPHHENEIAQSEALTGKKFANYWMHAAFLNVNNQKMSKSLNNFLTAREALKEYDADVIRFLMLSGHYRIQLNFSKDLLDSAKASIERLYNAIGNLENLISEVKVEKMTEEERRQRRYEMSETYRRKVLRFTLQFNSTTDMEAREWFEKNNKSGAYLKQLILEDKARRLGETGADMEKRH